MAHGYEDETLGAYGMAPNVPADTWFSVNTQTGAWQLPGQPTLASSAGMPDVTAPAQVGGTPDQAPLSIGQVAGGFAPPLGAQPRLQRAARLSEQGLLAPQPTIWESIARGIGMASPQGRAILQGFDTQQQQGIQNRLALRRQQLLEDQEARQGVKDEYAAFADLSKIKNKALRNLQFDRIVAQRAEAGTPLPADFVEAFKKSSLVEGEGIAQAYGHLLQKTGFSPEQVTSILENSDAATIKDLLEGTIKVRKLQTEEDEAKALQRIQAGGTLGEVSGVTQSASPPGAEQRPRGYVESGTTQPIIGSDKLTPTFTAKATEVANRLQMNPQDLLRIISFETGGTFNPAERNRAGSGATGLIQFTEKTAKALGTTTAVLAKMSPEEQLDYVEKYLTPYKGKLGNLKDAYLAVLKPAALGQGLDAPLFTREQDPLAYRQNAGLDTGGKGQVTVGDALGAVMRTTTGGGTQAPAPDTRMQVAGPGAPAPTTPAPSAADSAALTGLKQAIAQKQQQIQQLSGLSSERANKVADNMRADLKILQDRHDRLEDRLTEGPRAVARETALQPLKLAQQRAGAEVSLEAKANEPIGVDNGRKMGLPPATRWKDVPKDVRVLEDPSPGERQKFSDYKASQAGIGRVLTMLEQPGAQKIIGTLFSEPENTFNRRLGEWLSTVSPEQRKFVASMAAEIAEIRHALSGAAVSPQEFANLKPMMPSADDPDVATVRAKLEALQEWIVRKHDAYRDQLDQVGIRTPKALERPAEPPKPGPNVDKFKKLVQ